MKNCESGQYTIPNLKNAFLMLEQMRIAGRAQRLSEISEILDIPTTTAMRILKTLEEFDAVRKEGGKYKIGDYISNFADSVRARSTIGERINNYLVGLTRKSGETSHMCVPAGNSGFVLRECSTWQSLRSISVEGTFIDLSCSSAGKIFLADSLKNNPDFLRGYKPSVRTPKSIRSVSALKKELQKVVREDWALDREEYNIGVICLSVPIRDCGGMLIGALGITAPSVRMGGSKIGEFLKMLREVSRDFEKANGAYLNSLRSKKLF